MNFDADIHVAQRTDANDFADPPPNCTYCSSVLANVQILNASQDG